jgi:hypothetical protein
VVIFGIFLLFLSYILCQRGHFLAFLGVFGRFLVTLTLKNNPNPKKRNPNQNNPNPN